MTTLDTTRRPALDEGLEAEAGLRLPGWLRLPVLVGVVVAIGSVLRLASTSPLWLDEAQTVAFAQLPLTQLPDALRTDGAPPLYYVLLHGWMELFGDGAWAVRSLSMLASFAALPLIWLVVRRLGGDATTAACAVLLLAANPWAISYAGEARMYALVVVLVLLGALVAERVRRSVHVRWVIALGVITSALLWMHYWALFLLVAAAVVLLAVAWRRPAERAFVRRTVTGLTGGGLTFMPWLPTLMYQSKYTGAPWAARPDLGTLAALPMDWWGGGGPAGRLAGSVVILVLAAALFSRRGWGGSTVLARPSGMAALVGALLGATLLVALGASLVGDGAVVPRYTAVVVPVMIVLLALGVARLPATGATAVLATLVSLGLLAGFTAARTPHTQAGAIADILNAKAKRGDLIVYCPDQLAPAIERRLELSKVTRFTLPVQSDPRIVDWTAYTARIAEISPRAAARRITEHLEGRPQRAVWMVWGWGYRTHRHLCSPVRTRLVADLGVPTIAYDGSVRRGGERAIMERFTG